MHFKNILQKLWLLSTKEFFKRKFSVDPGLYIVGEMPKKLNLVIFDLSDKRFVHIGDSLFFEPIMQFFMKIGARVMVLPTLQMKEYFRIAGYEIPDNKDIFSANLICSTYWMRQSIECLGKCTKFYFDFTEKKIDYYASIYFIQKLSKLIQPDFVFEANLKPFKPDIDYKFLKNNTNKYLIYNNAVDSGKFRISSKSEAVLIEKVKELRGLNFKIIAIGKPRNPIECKHEELIDIDLRGKTSVIDIFSLFNSDNVIGSVSYDTAIAHIAILYNKTAWIKFRKFRKKYLNYLKNYIFPFYKTNKSNAIFL